MFAAARILLNEKRGNSQILRNRTPNCEGVFACALLLGSAFNEKAGNRLILRNEKAKRHKPLRYKVQFVLFAVAGDCSCGKFCGAVTAHLVDVVLEADQQCTFGRDRPELLYHRRNRTG